MKPEQQPEATSALDREDALPALADLAQNPIYVRSQEAFYRNLADLLKRHEEEWVAYHGDEYVVAASTINEAWEHCLRRGLKPGEFAVLFVHNYARDDHDTELGWASEM